MSTDLTVNGSRRETDPLIPGDKVPVTRVNRGYLLSSLNTAAAVGCGAAVLAEPDENTIKIVGLVGVGLLAFNAIWGWGMVIWTRPRQIERSQLKPGDVLIQQAAFRNLTGEGSALLMLERTDLD